MTETTATIMTETVPATLTAALQRRFPWGGRTITPAPPTAGGLRAWTWRVQDRAFTEGGWVFAPPAKDQFWWGYSAASAADAERYFAANPA